MFGLEDCPGLTEFISSVVTPEKVLHQTVYPNLSLMTFGHSIVERPFMTQKAHIDKFRKITEDFDYVVFDSNRILGSSDSTLISKLFDGVILTVECEKTKWEVVQKALEKMKNIDANVLGLVLSKRKFYIPKVLYGRE
ncbi:MAG: CpsD/CapB family tyrosine-protein kinase [Bacteroidetes bacterium]|nr:CpsD/CapB family tyrosine-protein kinase [Bacteroidota bacterium]